MENLNGVHPQDGNQIVIAKNQGTIHIINNSKSNETKTFEDRLERVLDKIQTVLMDNVVEIRAKKPKKKRK